MKKIFFKSALILLSGVVFITSCNKDLDQFPEPAPQPAYPVGSGIQGKIASNPNDSLYNRLITISGLSSVLNDNTKSYTIFATNNNGMKVFVNAISGGLVPLAAPNSVFSGFLTANITPATAAAIIQYNTVGQKYSFSTFTGFPNYPVASLFQLSPTQPFVRSAIFPSTGLINYVNNVPMIDSTINVEASNGIIHHAGTVVFPPQRVLWERLNTDSNLTIFKAAILRADVGTVNPSTPLGALVGAFSNGGANFNVFAPTNLAMRQLLSALSGGAIPVGNPDASFIAFINANVSPVLAKGIVVYHVFDDRSNTLTTALVKRPGRVFSVNIPMTATTYPTLLSSADTTGVTYPRLAIAAMFSPTTGLVTSATVKGFVNATASNFLINSTPDSRPSYGLTPPSTPIQYVGTSDQHYVNGVIHLIDQVLRPQ